MKPKRREDVTVMRRWDKSPNHARVALIERLLAECPTTIDLEHALGVNFMLFFSRLTVFVRLNYLKKRIRLEGALRLIGKFLERAKPLVKFLEIGSTALLVEMLGQADFEVVTKKEKYQCLVLLNFLANVSEMCQDLIAYRNGVWNLLYALPVVGNEENLQLCSDLLRNLSQSPRIIESIQQDLVLSLILHEIGRKRPSSSDVDSIPADARILPIPAKTAISTVLLEMAKRSFKAHVPFPVLLDLSIVERMLFPLVFCLSTDLSITIAELVIIAIRLKPEHAKRAFRAVLASVARLDTDHEVCEGALMIVEHFCKHHDVDFVVRPSVLIELFGWKLSSHDCNPLGKYSVRALRKWAAVTNWFCLREEPDDVADDGVLDTVSAVRELFGEVHFKNCFPEAAGEKKREVQTVNLLQLQDYLEEKFRRTKFDCEKAAQVLRVATFWSSRGSSRGAHSRPPSKKGTT